jgi:serine/alanine racemase
MIKVSLKSTGKLDSFRLIAAFLIVAIHTSPLITFSGAADFVLTRIIARVAVPFFFMVTGYFMYPHTQNRDSQYFKEFYKKIAFIYGASCLLYLPLNLYAGYFKEPGLWKNMIKDILINGTFYHLWYLPAVLLGVPIATVLIKKVGIRTALLIAVTFYVIGLFGDSYYGVTEQIPWLKSFYSFIFRITDYTRNGLFLAPVFLILGAMLRWKQSRLTLAKSLVGIGTSLIFLLTEGILLNRFSFQRHDSMYFMLLPCMYFLFELLLMLKPKTSKRMRSLSMLVYVLHPWMIVLLRGFAKVIHLQKLLIENSILHYLAVSLLSFTAACFIVFLGERIKTIKPSKGSRAWVEIDLEALRHNARALQGILSEQCSLMAVVKANAYGHGDVQTAKALNQEGVDAFAVATLEEAIHLRKNGIKGDILILGYTNPEDIPCLSRYQLTQTVIDVDYAKLLSGRGKKIKVHLKLDTGMHRLGVDFDQIASIESIYQCRNLSIEGVFSHLGVSDSLKEEDVAYTKMQIDRFFHTVKLLQGKGYPTGKLHIQASYGILNYPGLPCDYARAGIALYGVLSRNDRTLIKADLKPVLSIKARIAMIKDVRIGEEVGYGRQYIAPKEKKIAIVTIGYADGIPRNLAEHNAYVLVHSQMAPIVGRICMDQLFIDVTHIEEVGQNDIVTIIGIDGAEQVSCEDIAEKCSTISNDILSRLGDRLNHIFV